MSRAEEPHTTSSRSGLTHGLRRHPGELAVVLRGAVAELPRPVHLVAEAPHPHVERQVAPVAAAQLARRRPPGDVRVLEQVEGLGHAAGPEVDREHELRAHLFEPAGELVQPHLVRLGGVPREVEATGAPLTRPHRVLPAEARDEVAARVADGRDTELLHELDDVLSEAVGIRARVTGLVDAVVDMPPEVLDEAAEESAVDGSDRVGCDGDVGGEHGKRPPRQRSASGDAGSRRVAMSSRSQSAESLRMRSCVS